MHQRALKGTDHIVKDLVHQKKVRPEVQDLLQRVSRKFLHEEYQSIPGPISKGLAIEPISPQDFFTKTGVVKKEVLDLCDSPCRTLTEYEKELAEVNQRARDLEMMIEQRKKKQDLAHAIAGHLSPVMNDATVSASDVAKRMVEEDLGDDIQALDSNDIRALFVPPLKVGLCKRIVNQLKSFEIKVNLIWMQLQMTSNSG